MLDAEDAGQERAGWKQRALVVAGGLAGASAILAVVLYLGSWAYDYRRFSLHQARLERALAQHPGADQLDAGLAAEGAHLLARPAGHDAMREAALRWAGRRAGQVEARGRAASEARVYLAGDMVYFVFFDSAGKMSAFACVSR